MNLKVDHKKGIGSEYNNEAKIVVVKGKITLKGSTELKINGQSNDTDSSNFYLHCIEGILFMKDESKADIRITGIASNQSKLFCVYEGNLTLEGTGTFTGNIDSDDNVLYSHVLEYEPIFKSYAYDKLGARNQKNLVLKPSELSNEAYINNLYEVEELTAAFNKDTLEYTAKSQTGSTFKLKVFTNFLIQH